MKHYWKLLITTLIIFLTIGTFYISGKVNASLHPEFVIKTLSGNEKEVENLTLSGDYIKNGELKDSFYQDIKGTTYYGELSFLDRQTGFFNTPSEIKRLQKDYRNFMRGKQKNLALFFEDENVLAYANIPWDYTQRILNELSFDIEILDKKSQKITVIKQVLPKQKNYDYTGIEDVQIFNGNLVVVASISVSNSEDDSTDREIRQYTFDIASQKLISNDLIQAAEREKDNRRADISILNNSRNLTSQKYLLIEKEMFETMIPENDGYTEKEIDRKLYIYNLETKEQEEVLLSQEVKNYHYATLIDTTIYFDNNTENGLEIIPYHIDSKKFAPKQVYNIEVKDHLNPLIHIKDHKLYLVSPYQDKNSKATLLVTDLKTGKILYNGQIEINSPDKMPEGYHLEIYSLDV